MFKATRRRIPQKASRNLLTCRVEILSWNASVNCVYIFEQKCAVHEITTHLTNLLLLHVSQEDNEIPTSVMVKDSLKTPQPSQYDAESTHPTPSIAGSVDGRGNEEGLQTISLSSDDDDDVTLHQEESLAGDDEMAAGSSRTFERRADKFKRNSLKKVDSLKKAFSRQSIEKKMTQIGTKIVPPEKRDKIKKSLTPNNPKSPTSKSSSFKVSPMTFNVKKVRDGEVSTEVSPVEGAHVEIPPLGGLDVEVPTAEVHVDEGVVEKIQEALSPSTPDSLKAEPAVNGNASAIECDITDDHSAGLAVPEQDEDIGEEEEDEEVDEKQKTPVETAADTQITTATTTVEEVH